MFAVIKTGGKQYKVTEGQKISVEKIAALPGEKVKISAVLMLGGSSQQIGTPFIKDAAVIAEVVDHTKGPKLIHYVKRRRKHSSQRTKGHRQSLTQLKISEILPKGGEKNNITPLVEMGSLSQEARNAFMDKLAKAAEKPLVTATLVKEIKTEAKAEVKDDPKASTPAAKADAPKPVEPSAEEKTATKVKQPSEESTNNAQNTDKDKE